MRGLSAPGLVGAGFRRRRAFPPPATLPRCPPSRGGRAAGRRRSAARFLRLDVQRIGRGLYSPRAGLPAKLWTSLAPVSGIEFSVSRIFILGLVITAGPHSGRRRYGAPAFHSGPRHHGGPSLWASSLWRARNLCHWRVEPGTRTAPILGHRVVRVRWYPARFLKFCRRHGGEPHLPATGKTLRSRVGHDLGGVGGGGMPPPVTLVAPAELS